MILLWRCLCEKQRLRHLFEYSPPPQSQRVLWQAKKSQINKLLFSSVNISGFKWNLHESPGGAHPHGHTQWGRRLEGWPNPAARLTRQVWCCTRDGMGHTACLFRTVPVALTGATQLRADGISSCCYIVNVHNHPSWATSCKNVMARCSSIPMSALWSHLTCSYIAILVCTCLTAIFIEK